MVRVALLAGLGFAFFGCSAGEEFRTSSTNLSITGEGQDGKPVSVNANQRVQEALRYLSAGGDNSPTEILINDGGAAIRVWRDERGSTHVSFDASATRKSEQAAIEAQRSDFNARVADLKGVIDQAVADNREFRDRLDAERAEVERQRAEANRYRDEAAAARFSAERLQEQLRLTVEKAAATQAELAAKELEIAALIDRLEYEKRKWSEEAGDLVPFATGRSLRRVSTTAFLLEGDRREPDDEVAARSALNRARAILERYRNDPGKSRRFFQTVVANYPTSHAAREASAALTALADSQ